MFSIDERPLKASVHQHHAATRASPDLRCCALKVNSITLLHVEHNVTLEKRRWCRNHYLPGG